MAELRLYRDIFCITQNGIGIQTKTLITPTEETTGVFFISPNLVT